MVLLLTLEAGYLGLANGYQVPMFQLILSALGVAFIIMGKYFDSVRSHYFISIKTSWTLNNDPVRQQTIDWPVRRPRFYQRFSWVSWHQ